VSVVNDDSGGGDIEKYFARHAVINCLGATANELVSTLGYELALCVDSHDACVTAPIPKATLPAPHRIWPLVVDVRDAHHSSCFYFHQNQRGQIVASNAPNPKVEGFDTREGCNFLPNISKRAVMLIPALESVEVRHVWRGLYANTKDGNPLVGPDPKHPGLIHAVGMGGQGFMLGPGVAKLLVRMLTNQPREIDAVVFKEFDPFRSFAGGEELLR